MFAICESFRGIRGMVGTAHVPVRCVRSRIQATTSSWSALPAATRSISPASVSTSCDLHVLPLGLEEVRGQKERRPLVRVDSGMVRDEMLEQHGRLLDRAAVLLDAAERRERRMERGLGERHS